MRKKGVEISMNTIVIAAIALLVLIVLVLIFTGQTGKFARGINDCKGKGGGTSPGDCTDTSADCAAKGGIPSGSCIFYDDDGKRTTDDRDEKKVCCVIKR